VELVLKIKELLYERGFTIAGARRQLTKRRALTGAEREEVLSRVRKGLGEILALLERKT
jgi:hypothetical protein